MSVKILKVFITIRGWERKTQLSPTHSLWLSPTYYGERARATFLERAWARSARVEGVCALQEENSFETSTRISEIWNDTWTST